MRIHYTNQGFEHSVDSILLFEEDGTAPFWSDALFYFYPNLSKEKMTALDAAGRKAYLLGALRPVWEGLKEELDSKVRLYQAQFDQYHAQIEDALSEAFETDTGKLFNDLAANITLNPVCPRFLKEKYFDLFYKNSERGALGISLHEGIHYLWFHV